MDKNKMTIEDLALITQSGFKEISNKLDSEINGVNVELKEVNTRLDKIENIFLRNHENRVENLEDKMRKVETALER